MRHEQSSLLVGMRLVMLTLTRGEPMSNLYLVALLCVGLLVLGAWVSERPPSLMAETNDKEKKLAFRATAVRYQVKNVDISATFYTKHLGFKLEQQSGQAFGRVSNGTLMLFLSGPGSSGSRPLPDGRKQRAGRMESNRP
jgi:hypothetical protein